MWQAVLFLLKTREHFVKQFEWQADHVGGAACDETDPRDAILVTERASLSLPRISDQIILQILVRHLIHHQPGDGDLKLFFVAWPLPKTKATENTMFAAAQQLQHMPRVVLVAWFAEYLAEALGDRIAADDDPLLDGRYHVGRFLKGEASDQIRRRFAAANSTLRIFARRDDLEFIAGRFQELTSARRLAGKDQVHGSYVIRESCATKKP